ncbi:hypothetical protein MQE36_11745 [Zhouia spongiae]|uniref:Uncharacterized protein n=1 Tax=Zhouia spongiae TaxID=2202721 RepID=A0ABY3YJE6_9FLAO|nr:hypothetical protein [Zhouia spongiae]UNY97757.1 hypothetical protein MQE36_11745 [Zhouia spongiae]
MKKKEIKKLQALAQGKLNTIRPSNVREDRFKASFLEFKGYLDLFVTIEALLNVCILASQGDSFSPSFVKCPEEEIQKTLELAVQLLPFEEGEFLDEAYHMLKKKT